MIWAKARPKVSDLDQLLEDPATKDQAFDLIRSLIEVIRLVPEDGALKVELRGELAGILALCGGHAKSRTLSDPAFAGRQLKMVAGTRNHLELPLLCSEFHV